MNPTGVDRTNALVVHPIVAGAPARDPGLRLEEASGLAEALDLAVGRAMAVSLRDVKPKAFFGTGKVEEIRALVEAADAGVVVVDAAITPVQQRNLEKAWNAKVLDRTGLILEIFGRRARTREGRLQVELARLDYEKSRLVRTWTHLERQRGGRGFLGGPGETQIEADRRALRARMAKIRRELEDVRRTRGLHRAQRRKIPYPLIALVGYTNAGKSSLFNALTRAAVVAKDMPFATLDPTLRGVRLPSGVKAMLSDTVGFISDLPPELVAAFEATLEEVREADLLVHVRDIAHGEAEEQKADVETILARLEAGEDEGQRVIEAWNKIDRTDPDTRAVLALKAGRLRAEEGRACVLTSAITGEGLDALVSAVDAAVTEGARLWRARIAPGEGRALAWLHEHGEVVGETRDEAGAGEVLVRLSSMAAGRFRRSFGHLTSADGAKDAEAAE